MIDIMYRNYLQKTKVHDDEKYVVDKYDDFDEKVNKRVLLF